MILNLFGRSGPRLDFFKKITVFSVTFYSFGGEINHPATGSVAKYLLRIFE